MVTLHTMVIYFPKGHVKSHKSVVAISYVLQHNATMVYSIIKSLIPFMRIEYPELKNIHYLTGSPTSQYRNKTIFQLLSLHESEFNVTATGNMELSRSRTWQRAMRWLRRQRQALCNVAVKQN